MSDTTTYDGSFDGDDMYDHVQPADDPRQDDPEEGRYSGYRADGSWYEHDVWGGGEHRDGSP